ncbi:MAG TPA: hypothetical protein VLI90_19165 [Tepidisphaeraceae bacterium]|nr:hypothetical protein [Tepidisphaeraceae bacterium]
MQKPLNGGGFSEELLTAKFEVISDGDYAELVGSPLSRLSTPDKPQGDLPLLQRALKGFEGLSDEDHKAVPDDVAVPVLLAQPYVVVGLVRGYMEMLGKRATKN